MTDTDHGHTPEPELIAAPVHLPSGPAAGLPRLEVRALTKSYRRRVVLRSVDMSVHAGDAVALIGRNGAGKSTLLGCITGDRLPDRGEIRVCGADPFADPVAVAECMGFVPEQPFLYGELTIGETLDFVADARQIPRSDARAEGERLLALLGMPGAESLLCRELSQGMGRKVAVVVALLHRPAMIVLDEAFNGLDQASGARLADEVDRRRTAGAAVILSSHDLTFLAERCNRGLLLAPDASPSLLDGAEWQRWRSAPSLDPR